MDRMELDEKEKLMEFCTVELQKLESEDLDNKGREYYNTVKQIQHVLLTNMDLHSAIEELEKKQDVKLAQSRKPLIFSRTRRQHRNGTVEELSSAKRLDKLQKLLTLSSELILKN